MRDAVAINAAPLFTKTDRKWLNENRFNHIDSELFNVLPPIVYILPFFPSQETPVETVVKVVQVSSMLGYMQV